jgi:serine/threonine protein kinase
MSLEIGQIVEGKYRIVRLLGEGGMGAVYEGENLRINRRVAIKVLHAGFTENREVTQRFEREAQAAGRIGNDHILQVLDLGGLPSGDHFIVMEYLDGEPLSGRIKRVVRLTPFELAPIARQVLVGLGAAHDAGIVHRDLKPDNIFILKSKADRPDFVKIIDFGISKFQPLGGDGMKMTRTGVVMGTPYYMSPEQASGSRDADARSDIYAVGVIMFEAVTGQVPFDANTFNELMFKIVLSEVPAPESVVPGLDPAFASLISKAMARDVNMRFQSTEEFIRALDAWLTHGAGVTISPAGAGASHAELPVYGELANGASSPRRTAPGVASAETNDSALRLGDTPGERRSISTALVAGIAAALIGGGGVAFALLGHETQPPVVASAVTPSTVAPPATAVSPIAATTTAATSAPSSMILAPGGASAQPSLAASVQASAAAPGSLAPTTKATPPSAKLSAPRPVKPVQQGSSAPAAPPPTAETANKPRHLTRDFGY